MYVRRLSITVALVMSANVYALKTFKVINPTSGQSISVTCLRPSSIQCQTRIEEAKLRVMKQTNPERSTLSGARAEDNFNAVKDGVVNTGESIAEAGRDARDRTVEFAGDATNTVRNGVSRLADGASDLAGDAVEGTRNLANGVSNKVQDGVDYARGKTYRLRIPGIEHTMTFHCRGGLESRECKEDQKATEEAIRSGSTAESLQAHNLQPITNTAEAVGDVASDAASTLKDVAVGASNRVRDGLNRLSHTSCKNKLERHARDFDDHYRSKFQSGEQTELVSYMEKMDYIEGKLVDENAFKDCETHFENAMLGYQLEWISGNRLARRDTHIFDGVGLHKGDMGYWTNEQRSGLGEQAGAASR